MTQSNGVRTASFIAGGLALGALLGWAAWTMAGAGHGTYLPAILLFPYTMLIAAAVGTIWLPLMALAVLQYGVYGWLLAESRARVAKIALWHGVATLAALGVAAIRGTFL